MSKPRDIKKELAGYLGELHLPVMGRCFEDKARQAEREALGYEQFLLELVERECQERREKRIARLLQASKLPDRPFRTAFTRFDFALDPTPFPGSADRYIAGWGRGLNRRPLPS